MNRNKDFPEQNRKEVLHKTEQYLNKFNKEKNYRNWSKNLKRGDSKGELASETVVKMRNEERV